MKLVKVNMTTNNTNNWNKVYLDLVEDCEEQESKLTAWEEGFLDSIRQRLEREEGLSQQQYHVLEQIHEKVTR